MMRRQRAGRRPPPSQEESSSDEDDAFSNLSKKKGATPPSKSCTGAKTDTSNSNGADGGSRSNAPVKASTTSSMKRHHTDISKERKQHMDSLLEELEQAKNQASSRHSRHHPQQRGGSYVREGEESTTTNLFVGNLPLTVTEEDVTEVFGKFGELYSVKVMWPRGSNSMSSRGRLTAFVCFWERRDAESAMEACDDQDVFRRRHLLRIRWGKGLLTDQDRAERRRRHSEGSCRSRRSEGQERHHPHKRSRLSRDSANRSQPTPSQLDLESAVHVKPPSNPLRELFLTTVASFVAKDGSALENALLLKEGHSNPQYSFLAPQHQQEHVYYKWRVYSLAMGNSPHRWSTEPFQMMQDGKYWIPPPLNMLEAERRERQEEERRRQEDQEFKDRSGRTSDNRGGYGRKQFLSSTLTMDDRTELDRLLRRELTASRDAICRAMAFCLEHAAAWQDIAAELKSALTQHEGVSFETRIARLYLLSDVLFNSQQPGVKNAFRYRDAVEQMAPEVFESMGKTTSGVGRMTRNKLQNAARAVLNAWTHWSVYNPVFIDELEARFEGREWVKKEEEEVSPAVEEETRAIVKPKKESALVSKPQSRFEEVVVDEIPPFATEKRDAEASDMKKGAVAAADSSETHDAGQEVDIDGEPLEEGDLDEETLRLLDEEALVIDEKEDVDGVPVEEGDEVPMESLQSDQKKPEG